MRRTKVSYGWRAGMASLFVGAITIALAVRVVHGSSNESAPAWMHNLVNVALPDHDEKTDAVLLYSEETVEVQGNGKIRDTIRSAYKILRPGGTVHGEVRAFTSEGSKVVSQKGWCISENGKEYAVKEKDAVETSPMVYNGILASDVKMRTLKIPGAEPGSIVGSEIATEEVRFVLQDYWNFQGTSPVREARYRLSLPPGWEYKATWMNAAEIKPTASGNNTWEWMVSNVKGIRHEEHMPPWGSVAGQMIVSLIPPDGTKKGFITWTDLARWEAGLVEGRRAESPEIKQKVAEVTQGKTDTMEKMQAIANFMQRDIRYVAIELGIGGWQPHAAPDIYNHRYGDCKDKATLLSTMLKEVGVDSYYVIVNTERGEVNADTPPQRRFDHMILAIHLPDDVKPGPSDPVYTDASLGRLLIFDPTDEMTPLGMLRGELQGSYALLVRPSDGDLIRLPVLAAQTSGVRRIGHYSLAANGALSGEVTDTRYGDSAMFERYAYRDMTKKEDQIKPIEMLLGRSVGAYQITKATIGNLDVRDQPFQFKYSFVVPAYAKSAGDLLLVRSRVLGEMSSDLLEKKEPRKYPVEFEGPRKDSDRTEIALPEGYEVEEVPPAMDVEYSFGSYHSKTEVKANTLVYTRWMEIKEVSVPVEKMEDLRKFYRMIASDERNTAVLKPVEKAAAK